MGRFYGTQIQAGEMTIDDVPKLWKKSTEKWLKENSLERGANMAQIELKLEKQLLTIQNREILASGGV